jgi:hypothetical protein
MKIFTAGGGVAAQVAEHDDDLAAMAFEDLLVAHSRNSG